MTTVLTIIAVWLIAGVVVSILTGRACALGGDDEKR